LLIPINNRKNSVLFFSTKGAKTRSIIIKAGGGGGDI
jgi:hypothetical protein